jgi:aryl-alcohol dehydrogenase-like predicted oxidoreductase
MQKLVLGTANFGNKYGIANKTDLSQNEIDEILRWSTGRLEEIDTSEDYGESHVAISNYAKNFKVTTKINLNQIMSVQEISARIAKIKSNLQSRSVNRVLLRPRENNSTFTIRAIRELRVLQEDCNIREIGLTIYETKELERFVNELEGPLTFQIPLNIFNRSFEFFVRDNFATYNHVKFYARSIFLQGLLLMDIEEIPASLQEVKPSLSALNESLSQIGSSILEATFAYIKSQQWVTGVVIGVSNITELQKNIEMFDKFNSTNLGFLKEVVVPPSRILDPRLW